MQRLFIFSRMSDELYQSGEGTLLIEEVKSRLIFSCIRKEEGDCYAKGIDFVFLWVAVRRYAMWM